MQLLIIWLSDILRFRDTKGNASFIDADCVNCIGTLKLINSLDVSTLSRCLSGTLESEGGFRQGRLWQHWAVCIIWCASFIWIITFIVVLGREPWRILLLALIRNLFLNYTFLKRNCWEKYWTEDSETWLQVAAIYWYLKVVSTIVVGLQQTLLRIL